MGLFRDKVCALISIAASCPKGNGSEQHLHHFPDRVATCNENEEEEFIEVLDREGNLLTVKQQKKKKSCEVRNLRCRFASFP